MATILKDLIEAAEALSPTERIDLIEAVSELLRRDIRSEAIDLRATTSDALSGIDTTPFWRGKTLADLTKSQGVVPIARLEDLVAEFWPEDESADDVIEAVYAQRRVDRELEVW